MNIVCEKCHSKFKISDDKVPRGKVFHIPCPKCKEKISVDTRPVVKSEQDVKKTLIDNVASQSYDASEKPFDFIEKGAKTALLCEPDNAVRIKIKNALQKMGFHTIEPKTAEETLKRMRFHVFDIVVLNEMFDANLPEENDVLKYVKQLAMVTRRNIFVALLTKRFRTTDNMAAFNQSVNIVVNAKNIDEIDKILQSGIADNTAFYAVFKEMLVKSGKI